MAEIKTNAKRGKGKISNCVTIKDFYKDYKNTKKEKKKDFVDYSTYSKICKEFNKKLIKEIVEESQTVRLPHRLGDLFVIKKKIDLGAIPKNKWKVDYKKSKELGFIVYFDNDYKYYIRWNKKIAIFKWKSVYLFKACRTASRSIKDALNNNKDYYLK